MDAHSTSLAGFPAHIVAKVVAIDAELDQIHPGWKDRVPFDKAEYDTLARIKWLLKRRSLLTTTDGGHPAPRDWDVLIVRDTKNRRKCYAHPVIPRDIAPEVTREPPSPIVVAPPVALPVAVVTTKAAAPHRRRQVPA